MTFLPLDVRRFGDRLGGRSSFALNSFALKVWFVLVSVLVAGGCRGGDVRPDGTGGHSSGGTGSCVSSGEEAIGTLGLYREAGLGGGGGEGGAESATEKFVPLAAGADVTLQWGSQVGMGLALVLELQHLAPEDFERVELSLVLDGEPLGVDVHESRAMVCLQGALYIEAMVMVDVGPHPSVTSVVQLEGREVDAHFSTLGKGPDGPVEVLSGDLPVVLHL